jgi:ABC-type Zn2+ transport system substrate-binding protein/surface adhesin
MTRFLITTSMAAAIAIAGASGCNDDPQPAPNPPVASEKPKADAHDHDHDHADGEKHAHDEDHANPLDLGTKTMAGLTLKAIQEEPVKAGGEGAFRLLITGGKPKAVRFWVGAENGQGSVKAKAEEDTTDNWHTHIEIPDPLPSGSQFYAEVEPQTGAKFTVSFDLK